MLKNVDNISYTDKPLLITGWSKVKTLYPNQKINNKQISDNIFWTFSEREKRTENENDIKKFKKYCIDYINSKYKYYFLNPFELSFWNIKKLISKINDVKDNKYYHFDGKHFFILIENYIFGINLDFLSYGKISANKVKKWLKLKNFEIIEDSPIFNIEEINNKKHLIPILGKDKYEKQLIIGYIFE